MSGPWKATIVFSIYITDLHALNFLMQVLMENYGENSVKIGIPSANDIHATLGNKWLLHPLFLFLVILALSKWMVQVYAYSFIFL